MTRFRFARPLTVTVSILLVMFSAARLVAAQAPPAWAHPAGTITGIAGVDAAIRAMEAQDAAALQSQFLFTSTPCTEPGIGEVKCPEGRPVGTPVEVFLSGGCEGSHVEAGDPVLTGVAQEMTARTMFLYAVGNLAASFAPATHVLFFGTANDPGTAGQAASGEQAVMIFTDATGIRSVNAGCGSTVAQRVADIAPVSFVLAPRSAPPGPPDTGTGLVPGRSSRLPWTTVMLVLGVITAAGVLIVRRAWSQANG